MTSATANEFIVNYYNWKDINTPFFSYFFLYESLKAPELRIHLKCVYRLNSKNIVWSREANKIETHVSMRQTLTIKINIGTADMSRNYAASQWRITSPTSIHFNRIHLNSGCLNSTVQIWKSHQIVRHKSRFKLINAHDRIQIYALDNLKMRISDFIL